MKLNKEKLMEALNSVKQTVKGVFNTDVNESTAKDRKGKQGAFAGVTAVYNVLSAAPVYVDISDDNIPDIDQADNVYADAAETTPYPDGTYTIADANGNATQFSFTVVAGVVTTVVDPANAGPGNPVQQAAPQPAPAPTPTGAQGAPAPAPMPQPAPAPMPQPVPRFNINLPESFAAFKAEFKPGEFTAENIYADITAMLNKFATGTIDERIANLETMVKAVMLYCYGYDIKRAEEQIAVNEAINTYKTTIADTQLSSQKKETQLLALKESNEKLIGLFEQFLELPSADPVLSEKDKQKFEKQESKETKADQIAKTLKTIREEKAKK